MVKVAGSQLRVWLLFKGEIGVRNAHFKESFTLVPGRKMLVVRDKLLAPVLLGPLVNSGHHSSLSQVWRRGRLVGPAPCAATVKAEGN